MQQPVEVLQFLVIHFLVLLSVRVNGDLLKVFGFNGSERFNHPVETRYFAHEHKIFEFRCFGEVREVSPRCDCVREGRSGTGQSKGSGRERTQLETVNGEGH